MDTIPPLLARVRKIYDQPYPPAGRPGCRDCRLLDGLVENMSIRLPFSVREALEWKLWELRGELQYLCFEQGRIFQSEQEHRLGLIADEKSSKEIYEESKQVRLQIAALERRLRGEAGGR